MNVVVADITTLEVEAIVNAANEGLLVGGGVCGAIFRAAGPRLAGACRELAPCPTGEARITPGFNAHARWIIHAVGPAWCGGGRNEAEHLSSAYRESLRLAASIGAASIAFPALSTGIYGYPRAEAAKVAVGTVRDWYNASVVPQRLVFCCFSDEDAMLYRDLLGGD